MCNDMLTNKPDINIDDILWEATCIARSDPAELYDEHGNLRRFDEISKECLTAIANVKVQLKSSGQHDEDGRPIMTPSVKIDFHNKLRALKLLGKHLGLF